MISVHLNTKVQPLCDLKVKMMEKYIYMRLHTCVKIQDGRYKELEKNGDIFFYNFYHP